MNSQPNASVDDPETRTRAKALERELHEDNCRKVDRLFVCLMIVQWVLGVLTALYVAPYSWIGEQSLLHAHVWAAIGLGGLISSAPILLGIFYPGTAITRHVIAVSQALWGALLIHLSGGRIETHFHIFCSLAFIAFYRDWKVLMTMTAVVAADHSIRGVLFPLSIYGVVLESPYRWVEHLLWVLVEDFILVHSCVRGLHETRAVCEKQLILERVNRDVEIRIEERTRELQSKTQQLEQFSLVVKHTDNSVLILDAEGRVESVNEGFTRMTGYDSSEIVGRIPVDVLGGPTTKLEERQHLKDGLRSRRPFTLVIHEHRKNGEQMILAVEGQPVFGDDGRLTRYLQIERDITRSVFERERLQKMTDVLEASSQQLEKLSLVAKYTDNGVIITDPRARIEWVNEGFTRITGYTLEEVQGRVPGHFLQGPETNPDTIAQVRAALERQEGINVEIVNYHKQGHSYWLDIELRPILDASGQVVNYIAIESDITERRKMQHERERLASELQDAARQAGMAELAGDVLHNVGNALNSINVSSQTLRQRIESTSLEHLSKASCLISEQEPQLADFLTTDKRGQQFPNLLRQLTATLLAERESQIEELHGLSEKVEHVKEIVASQASFSHCRVPPEPVCPKELLESAIRMNDASLEKHGITIVRTSDDLPEVLLEKHAALQVLINLVKNAKESVTESGVEVPTITVSAELTGGQIHFIVADNGVGIPEQNLVKIFQHGFSNKATGRGFGLHSSGNVAQELGGSLQAQSDGPGQGAKFTLCLPIRQTTVCSV